MRVRACLVIAVVALTGCSPDKKPDRSRAPAEPQTEPVAYALDRATLRELRHDYGRIVTDGREVAASEWDAYIGIVLVTYLEDHGIRLDDGPAELLREAERISRAQEAELMLLGDWHRRRYAKRLARLSPPAGELGDFHAEFTEEELPRAEAERAMRDWLRVFRQALANVSPETVVVIPLLE